jgi:hemoglobin-like flavoprotein
MTESELGAFLDSLDRCLTNPTFFDVFYDHFLKSSDEVRQKFKQTDFAHQKATLRLAFLLIVEANAHESGRFDVLDPIAFRHSRAGADIPPRLYDQWLDSLLYAVEACDDRFTDKTVKLWRNVFLPAIEYITSKY